MSLTQAGSNWGQPGSKLAGVDPGLIAGKARDGGEVRVSSSGDQMGGGGHLRAAGDEPRPVVAAVGLGVAGNGTGDDLGCCQSSGELGLVARRHGEVRGVVLRAPGVR